MNPYKKRMSQTLMAAMMLTAVSGCAVGREFRNAALPSLQSGVSLILDGLVDGLFAAIEPDVTAGDG